MEQELIGILIGLAEKHPFLLGALGAIGGLRFVFKPIMEALKALAKATPSAKDDKILEDVEQSKFYKALVFLVDYIASIKLPVKK